MEKKINIAELLKDCPKGMELDCVLYEGAIFECISDKEILYPIQVQTPEGNMLLSEYGCTSPSKHAKCVISPKCKTTWEGFVPPCKFKVGNNIKKKGLDDCYAIEIAAVVQPIYTFKGGNWQSIEYVDKEYELVPTNLTSLL